MSASQHLVSVAELLNQAVAFHHAGKLTDAERRYLQVLRTQPTHFHARHFLGVLRFQQGRYAEALELIGTALKMKPDAVDALYHHGNALQHLNRSEEALASYDKALAIRSDYADAWINRGTALQNLRRFEEALASYDKALTVKPDCVDALYNRGILLQESRRFEEALASYDGVLSAKPDHPEALNNRGNTLKELKRLEDALASYDRALAIKPRHLEALYNRGNTLQTLGRFEEALRSYDAALAIKPDQPEALNNCGNTLLSLNRFTDALICFEKAVDIKPDYVDAIDNCGISLQYLSHFEEALTRHHKALAIEPDNVKALNNRGSALQELKRFGEALASYDKALFLKPDHANAFAGLANSVLNSCNWERGAETAAEIEAGIASGKKVVSPFTLLGYSADVSLQRECAEKYLRDKVAVPAASLWNGALYRHDKIRIAYLSSDFHDHALAYLVTELFELHDRAHFDALGISFGKDDHSEARARLIKAFDRFYDVRSKSDGDIAKLLLELEVDIAVDLNGHTKNARSGIFAFRPAPIQANYLGYPGTMGADFIDYVIADAIVLPFDRQPFFTEKIVHLPDCYQANDSKRVVSARMPTRQEAGLPERGFVFCCFNNNWKITRPVFDVWMRLLRSIDGSVLWLVQDSPDAKGNLREEAVRRGVDSNRLIFAARVKLPDHLARQRLADLFLDTLPYNAHTTASDALRMGVPVLTCRGETFAGRVATSLLHAIGLPELVTNTLADYETLAWRLATDSSLFQSIRKKLDDNQSRHPLFDTDRFRRHLEAAYTTMWEIWRRGESPRSFSVQAYGAEPDPR